MAYFYFDFRDSDKCLHSLIPSPQCPPHCLLFVLTSAALSSACLLYGERTDQEKNLLERDNISDGLHILLNRTLHSKSLARHSQL